MGGFEMKYFEMIIKDKNKVLGRIIKREVDINNPEHMPVYSHDKRNGFLYISIGEYSHLDDIIENLPIGTTLKIVNGGRDE